MLQEYAKAAPSRFKLINHPHIVSRYRTQRIAYGRNKILERIQSDYSDYEFFMSIDLDDVSKGTMNKKQLEEVLKDSSKYDAVSFDIKNGYYDFWALRYVPFTVNYFDLPISTMKRDITKKLKNLKIMNSFL